MLPPSVSLLAKPRQVNSFRYAEHVNKKEADKPAKLVSLSRLPCRPDLKGQQKNREPKCCLSDYIEQRLSPGVNIVYRRGGNFITKLLTKKLVDMGYCV